MGHRHLGEGPAEHQRDAGHDHVGQDGGRPGHVHRQAGGQEQPGANGPAERHRHLLRGRELAGQPLFVGDGRVLLGGGHGVGECTSGRASEAAAVTSRGALTLDEFRARFPIFGHRVYVNSCSQGALSLDVQAGLEAFIASWHSSGSPWDRWVGEVERLRAAFATSIGADADEIAVMPSASTAIAGIATALSFDSRRRAIVLGEFEFPTMAHVWLAQQRRGATIDWVRARGETLPVEAYEARIDERTLVVPAAHVCFGNGYRLDIGTLAALCRERGAYLMLDDYQHTGTGPLDVHALGRLHGDRSLEVPARSGWHRLPLRATRPDCQARAVVDRLVRTRRALCLQPRPARLGVDRAAVRGRIAPGAERLRRRRWPRTPEPHRARGHRRADPGAHRSQ